MESTSYYNSFYAELSKLDAKSNKYEKIRDVFVPIRPSSKILDVGCGHGSVSYKLIAEGHKLYGLEINKQAIESLKSHGFNIIEQSLTEPLPGTVGKFDSIFILDVLEHVFEPVEVLRHFKNYLVDDGKMIVTVPLYFDLVDRIRILWTGSIISYDNLAYGSHYFKKFRSYNYDHIRFFRPQDLNEMAQLSGLEIEKVVYGVCGLPGIVGKFARLLINKYTATWWPSLFAHHAKLVLKLKH